MHLRKMISSFHQDHIKKLIANFLFVNSTLLIVISFIKLKKQKNNPKNYYAKARSTHKKRKEIKSVHFIFFAQTLNSLAYIFYQQ